MIYGFLKNVVDYVLPPRCLACTELIVTSDSFCADCWNNLNFVAKPYCMICGSLLGISTMENITCGKCITTKPYYDSMRSLFIFDDNSRKIIHAFKYYDKTHMAKCFARLLYSKYNTELQDIDIITSVPMHKLKRLMRMYNQSQILSEELNNMMHKTLYNDLLIKYKMTKSQTVLSGKSRTQNISGSIRVNDNYRLQNKNILLVDDVTTTGATILECSKLLKAAGSNVVRVITIART